MSKVIINYVLLDIALQKADNKSDEEEISEDSCNPPKKIKLQGATQLELSFPTNTIGKYTAT